MLDGKSASGRKLRGNDEIPTRMQALKMYTSGSAWLAHDEHQRGTFEVGKLADLAVLSDDYLQVPIEKMANIHSKLTMVGGKIVHIEN
jgi:predicted amidohydrolase YtcJ